MAGSQVSQEESNPVGKVFVLGLPNALGEHVIVLGGKRRRITSRAGVVAGERVRVTAISDDCLEVERVVPVIAAS